MWYILRSWIKRNFSLRFDNSLHSVALYNRYLDASPSPMTILTDFNCICMCSILLTRYIVFWIVDPYIGLEFLDWSYRCTKKYSFCKVFLFRNSLFAAYQGLRRLSFDYFINNHKKCVIFNFLEWTLMHINEEIKGFFSFLDIVKHSSSGF